MSNIFKGRMLTIATMHGKEQVMAPILQKSLGVEITLPENFDTDRYGTFSGEIERNLSPLETAKLKCIEACEFSNCTLAVASEGSFGQHPSSAFIPADDEIVVFMDIENNITIKSRVLSTQTNFSGGYFNDWNKVKEFAVQIGFPSHALILRKDKNDVKEVLKGINNWRELKAYVLAYLNRFGSLFLETDMRAMFNPKRMKVIEEATHKLVDVILNECPKCYFPGYDVVKVNNGLPCKLCGLPTKATLSYQYECTRCNFVSEIKYPQGIKFLEPQFCDFCNP